MIVLAVVVTLVCLSFPVAIWVRMRRTDTTTRAEIRARMSTIRNEYFGDQ